MPRGRDSELLHHLTAVPVSHVFITGPHRSGTTFLYSLLQATGRVNVVTAYHVLRSDELLTHHLAGKSELARKELAAELLAVGVLDRVIDGIPVSTDMPEEYGFVLGHGKPVAVLPENLSRFSTFCRKVQYTSQPDRPLLLKNPWDFSNSLFIKQHFPTAKFLYLHRHPARTLNSQLRAARSMLADQNPYVSLLSPRYGRLFNRPITLAIARLFWASRHNLGARLLARAYVQNCSRASQERRALPAGDRFDVSYERLCSSPNNTIAEILDWLSVNSTELPDLARNVSPRSGGILPEIERLQPRLATALQEYYKEFGYTSGG